MVVQDEHLSDGAAEIVSRGVRGDKTNLILTSGLSALKLVELPAQNAAVALLQTLQAYAIYCPNTPGLRGIVQDQQMRPPVGLSGGGLAEAFQGIQASLDDAHLDEVLAHTGTARQLLFTAHNPAVLDGLDLADDEVRLFAVERNSDGHTCMRRIALSDELRKQNEVYPLSRLWIMGNLGAVPEV